MTTPGGVPNLPTAALTLDTLAAKLQDTSTAAMKERAVERFPSIMDGSTGLSPASDLTPFGILTSIWAGFNSVVANADPADVDGPEDLPGLLLQFIEGLPVIGQFVGILEALLGTYDGDDQVLLTLQGWFGSLRTFLGGALTGNPFELLQPFLTALSGLAGTAIASANQATDIARQIMALVMQIVQGLDVRPVIGDFFEGLQGFAFWVLGWFGITQQSVTDTNPAVAGVLGRVGALESSGTAGLEGFADHFNRPAIGADWVTITPYNALNIEDSQYLHSYNHCAGRFDANTLITDTWHVQFTLARLDFGQSRFFVSTNGTTAESSFTNGLCIDVSSQWYGMQVTLYTMSAGLIPGTTLQTQRSWDYGVIKAGDVLAVEYIEADNVFYIYLNNVEVPELQFPDVSNLVSHGPGHREIAVLTNFNDSPSLSGPGFDDMSAYDIKIT